LPEGKAASVFQKTNERG